jgi:hypothetical protein
MRKKLSLGLVVLFLLLLANCSLFENDNAVFIVEPQANEVLVTGETFTVLAHIKVDDEISGYKVSLLLPIASDDTTSYWEYDSTLFVFPVPGDIHTTLTINDELTVPLDAPVNDDYRLLVDTYDAENRGRKGYSLPVRIRSAKD